MYQYHGVKTRISVIYYCTMQAPSLLTDFSPSREVQRQCVHDERVNILAIHQHSSVLRANSNTHDQSVSPPELCRFEPKLNSAKCPKTIALSFCESHLGTQWLVLNDFFLRRMYIPPAGRPAPERHFAVPQTLHLENTTRRGTKVSG